MYKCLRITFSGDFTAEFLRDSVQKAARKHVLEGTAQMVDVHRATVVVCGRKEKVDIFLDELHKELVGYDSYDVEIEPFLKEKDYRGVFRIIE